MRWCAEDLGLTLRWHYQDGIVLDAAVGILPSLTAASWVGMPAAANKYRCALELPQGTILFPTTYQEEIGKVSEW